MILSRRSFLVAAGAAVGGGLGSCGSGETRAPENPFQLGIASGDPSPDGIVLWTRLAPRPLQLGGGMPSRPVEVRWLVAEDEAATKIVREGTALALPELAHSVHVELSGLAPDRPYWYRFRVGDDESPIGRARTTPPVSSLP